MSSWLEKARETIEKVKSCYESLSEEAKSFPYRMDSCPFCVEFKKHEDERTPSKYDCEACPWVVFERDTCDKRGFSFDPVFVRIKRLNRWLRNIDIIQSRWETLKSGDWVNTVWGRRKIYCNCTADWSDELDKVCVGMDRKDPCKRVIVCNKCNYYPWIYVSGRKNKKGGRK